MLPELPPWVMNLVYAFLGALGAMVPKIFKTFADRQKLVVDDRSEFTSQVMTRLANLEEYLHTRESHHSEQLTAQAMLHRKDLADLREEYERRLKSRDAIIRDLRQRQNHLEQLVKQYHDDSTN